MSFKLAIPQVSYLTNFNPHLEGRGWDAHRIPCNTFVGAGVPVSDTPMVQSIYRIQEPM